MALPGESVKSSFQYIMSAVKHHTRDKKTFGGGDADVSHEENQEGGFVGGQLLGCDGGFNLRREWEGV